jgi:hypothetical protein
MTDDMLRLWSEIRELVDTVSVDIRKNISGNASAGVRARKGLRVIKSKSSELTKLSLALGKQRKDSAEDSEHVE